MKTEKDNDCSGDPAEDGLASDFQRLRACKSLDDAIEAQLLHGSYKQSGPFSDERNRWYQEVWHPLVFDVCRKLTTPNYKASSYNDGLCQQKSTLNELLTERMVRPDWVLLSNRSAYGDSLKTRVLLAILLCKKNLVTVPPDWLRDLWFFSHYQEAPTKQTSDQIEKLARNIEVFLTEQAIVDIREMTKPSLGLRVRSRDIAAKVLNVSDSTMQRKSSTTKKEISKHFGLDFQPTYSDYLAWDIDLSAISRYMAD